MVELSSLTPDQEAYFHCREQLWKAADLLRSADESLHSRPSSSTRAIAGPRPKPLKVITRSETAAGPVFDRAREAERLFYDLADLDSVDNDLIETPLASCIRELSLLELMTGASAVSDLRLLQVNGRGSDARDFAKKLRAQLILYLASLPGGEAKAAPDPGGSFEPFSIGLWVSGLHFERLLEPLLGCWLLKDRSGALHLLQAGFAADSSGVKRPAFLSHSSPQDRSQPAVWEETVVAMTAREDGAILSHRTGVILPAEPSPDEIRAFHLANLPLPVELETFAGGRI